jgi:hypothetical protein
VTQGSVLEITRGCDGKEIMAGKIFIGSNGLRAGWRLIILPSQGHFLSASLHGPVSLTGGTFGPEAAWPNLLLLAIWALVFAVWLREVKYSTNSTDQGGPSARPAFLTRF